MGFIRRSAAPMPLIMVAFLAAACTTDPYVHHANEFNRASPDYKAEPKDISAVVICYNGRETSAGRVKKLAEQECARFGKQARIEKQTFGDCTLAAPVQASFLCVGGRAHVPATGTGMAPAIGRGVRGTIDWRLPEWFYGPGAGR